MWTRSPQVISAGLLLDPFSRPDLCPGLPANNALLWGSRGTGKSSLIKAVLNHFTGQGQRLIEVDPEDLQQQALNYSRARAARSGRTARQFFNTFSAPTDSS